jgi:hypothetical protein
VASAIAAPESFVTWTDTSPAPGTVKVALPLASVVVTAVGGGASGPDPGTDGPLVGGALSSAGTLLPDVGAVGASDEHPLPKTPHDNATTRSESAMRL